MTCSVSSKPVRPPGSPRFRSSMDHWPRARPCAGLQSKEQAQPRSPVKSKGKAVMA